MLAQNVPVDCGQRSIHQIFVMCAHATNQRRGRHDKDSLLIGVKLFEEPYS